MKSLFVCTLLLIAAAPSFAADVNGYTAKYECRGGGANCNVDVATLVRKECQQTIYPSTSPTTDWNVVDWSKTVICIAAGDHTSRGPLTIPAWASGSATNYRVLRYDRASDNNDKPWNQTSTSQAKTRAVYVKGNYWIVHRLTITGATTNSGVLGTDNIFDSVLIENTQGANIRGFEFTAGANRNVLQNSVVRKTAKAPGTDQACVTMGHVQDVKVVNNELYDCTDTVMIAKQPIGYSTGVIIENNDLYTTAAYYTPDGLSCTENAVDLKTGGTTAKPFRVIHNRAWGWRANATGCSGTGASGTALSSNDDGGGAGYTLFQNNIVTDSYNGLDAAQGTPVHVSVIGNIFYNIQRPSGNGVAIDTGKSSNWEIYFNTIVNAQRAISFGVNTDARCNVAINGGSYQPSVSSGAQVDNNAFYNTAAVTTGNPNKTILRTSASEAAAVDYCFYRKLHTGPERVCIPYAGQTASAPHYKFCDATIGSRLDIGINDEPLLPAP